MLVRAIALSLALLIGIGTIIPLATQQTEAGPHKHRKHRKHAKHYKKYSKGWWRQYRARQRHNQRGRQESARALAKDWTKVRHRPRNQDGPSRGFHDL